MASDKSVISVEVCVAELCSDGVVCFLCLPERKKRKYANKLPCCNFCHQRWRQELLGEAEVKTRTFSLTADRTIFNMKAMWETNIWK